LVSRRDPIRRSVAVRSVYEYRFTCAHELGHLLMHPSPLPGDRQQEREADQFAAEFLTPAG
jgi:Zn-dependent peptidase ImmA (M78 family)